MKHLRSGAIYQVQLTNEALLSKLFESRVNDYVSLGIHEGENVSGRLCYRSVDMIHVSLVMYYVMVDIKTKIAYFVDLGSDKFGQYAQSDVNSIDDMITALG